MKLQKMKYMDKFFNVGNVGDSVDSGINHAKYENELENLICVSEKFQSKLTQFTPLDLTQEARDAESQSSEHIAETAKASLGNLYKDFGCEDQLQELVANLEPFDKSDFALELPSMPQGFERYQTMLNDFNVVDNFIFDFVPVTEHGEGKTTIVEQDEEDAFIQKLMANVSTSFRQFL